MPHSLRRRPAPIRFAFGAVAALCLTAGAATADAPRTFDTSAGKIEVTREAGPFEHPWSVAFLPDGQQLVTERDGRLLLLSFGKTTEVAGVPEVWARGQGGLLDVAVSRDFDRSGVIFLSFSESADGGARTAVARGELSMVGEPELLNVETIWRQAPVLRGRRHFGSRIVIAEDGALFVTTGDRGERERAQDLGNHVGKVVRILPSGQAAPDNPFVSRGDALPEIWSYGHRNVQGAALRPSDGALWTVEHGAAGGDEINQPRAGRNYGWPTISFGTHYSGAKIGVGTTAPGMQQPRFYWDPSIAPSGLSFYDGDLFPEWKGDLFVGALKYRLISRLDMDGDQVVGEERLLEDAFGRVRDVRTGPDGAIWFLTDDSEGALYRIAPVGR
ncbi:MAG: PQQ-dependent sugar dehydrogenase [Pseudomonadota bacterium]